VAVSALAVLLGWFYGPVLAAVGIVGASAAPFLVGGSSDAPWVFFYYFALIALAGLAVDTVKRWAWVSAVVLIATVAGSTLLFLDDAGDLHFLIFLALTTVAATATPVRSAVPGHDGPGFMVALMPRAEGTLRKLPDFPTRLVAGMMAVSSFAGWVVATDTRTADMELLALVFLMAMMALAVVWMRRAPALVEMPVLPGAAFLATIATGGAEGGPLLRQAQEAMTRAPETAPPMTYSILVVMGAIGTVLLFWRMIWAERSEGGLTLTPRALSAAVFLPTVLFILSFLWQPEMLLGDYGWALHVIAAAALLTFLAERTARMAQGEDKLLRVGFFAVAALVLIALALFLLLTKAALTLALGVMLVLVVLLDRRFDLPLLDGFVQLGVVVLGYRLTIDPGIERALDAPIPEMVVTYGGSLILMGAAWFLAAHRKGTAMRVMLESGVWTVAAVFANLVLIRAIGKSDADKHWAIGPMAAIWFGSAANQLYRQRVGSRFAKTLRGLLAVLFTLVGLGFTLLLVTFANPLLNWREPVLGVPVFSSLAVAFLPMAAVFAVAAWKVSTPAGSGFKPLVAFSGLAASCYAALEIRHLWQGPFIGLQLGVKDGELYTYTVVLLLTSFALLFIAFARRSVALRKLAMVGVGLTIAKVFLIDMAGLSGLIRVASFMGLGLSLAALAWLNRVMERQWSRDKDEGDENAADTAADDPSA